MWSIPLTNRKLKLLLSHITEFVQTSPVANFTNKMTDHAWDPQIPNLHPASDDYLQAALNMDSKEFGFPKVLHGFGMSENSRTPETQEFLNKFDPLNKRIGSFLGTPFSAVAISYPRDGFISWHHNGNAPGYNVIISYSSDGDGSFDYWDQDKKTIVHIPDVPDWSVKVGRFPGHAEGDHKLFWHRAVTKNPRITLAWVIDHVDLWRSMIEEISGEIPSYIVT